MKIAICGVMCSGKTTIANYIKKKLNNVTILSFADKIKELAYDLFDMKEKDRKLLIQIGQKLKEIDDKVWIKYTIKQSNLSENIIIDDLRFQNELDELIKNDFILIKLIITPELQLERLKKTYPDTWQNHIHYIRDKSESIHQLDNNLFHYIINIDKQEKNINKIIDDIISSKLLDKI